MDVKSLPDEARISHKIGFNVVRARGIVRPIIMEGGRPTRWEKIPTQVGRPLQDAFAPLPRGK